MTKDPFLYDGPIVRADGRRPYNHYLWPMAGDSWWAYDTFGHRGVSGRFHFEVIGLADGRWSTYGCIGSIERNQQWYDHGPPVVFATRERAIRISAARFIRLCRWARRWTGTPDYLTEAWAQKLINWALEIAKRPPQTLRALPVPRPKTGLPLLDFEAVR